MSELSTAFKSALESCDYTAMGAALPSSPMCTRAGLAKRCGDLSKRLLAVGAMATDNKVTSAMAGITSTISGWFDTLTSTAASAWAKLTNKVDAVKAWLAEGQSTGATSAAPASTAAPAIPASAHVVIPWFSQFEGGHGYEPGDTACFRASVAMAQQVPKLTVLGPDARIQIATAEDSQGGITVDPAKAAEGNAYIVGELLSGRPVVVGVSHKNPLTEGKKAYNADLITDHFVTITGFNTDASGRYFTFHEPGTSHATYGPDTVPTNRFRVDPATGMMVRPGEVAKGSTYHRRLQVSMVRRNAVQG